MHAFFCYTGGHAGSHHLTFQAAQSSAAAGLRSGPTASPWGACVQFRVPLPDDVKETKEKKKHTHTQRKKGSVRCAFF